MASDKEYREGLIAYSRGELSIKDLALTDPAFWHYVARVSARPGRQSEKEPFLGAAADALLRSDLDADAVSGRSEAFIQLLRHANPRVRRLALSHVRESMSPALLEALKAVALGRDRELAIEALHVIATDPDEAALAVLAEVLAHTSDVRGTLASQELRRAGTRSIPVLDRLLDSPDWAVRWRAVACLVHIEDRETLPLLLKALHDDSVDVAWLAADGLLALGPSAREPALKSVLNERIGVGTARALRHFAEHSSPRRVFSEILTATQGLGSLAAIPVAIEHALESMSAKGAAS